MISIGICDDEAPTRRALRTPLERKLQLLGISYRILEYDSGEALFSHPEREYLDILFLDIEMKQMNGMETAKNLRKRNSHTLLIFVTAYPDFVFQGYEVHAFHYILKPYEEHKIQAVLEQALEELGRDREPYFTLERKSGILKIPLKKVLAFSSDRRKVVIFLNDGSRPDFYGKLDEVESGLPDYFVRCHNRHLVNLNFVSALEKDRCICGALQFPVSRAFRQPLEIAFARLLLR
ncbi:DNA-binding response regulator [Lachnospiraceae bacterium]|jgi:DNA-binding LytR/AlgR family response regulator|nr:LytTR family DNA-binding domain-containing protein [uncultured Schaedlerella sp.]MCI8766343.1 response regulator transcription factor [Ruminococcus sp.]NBI99880.1 DNA-binding response regulator [Lachnospiraceae bacterium]